jgi:hypothetical protein
MFRFAGPLGLYKGFGAQVARIGPHTLISFIAFEQVLPPRRDLLQRLLPPRPPLPPALPPANGAHSFPASSVALAEFLQYNLLGQQCLFSAAAAAAATGIGVLRMQKWSMFAIHFQFQSQFQKCGMFSREKRICDWRAQEREHIHGDHGKLTQIQRVIRDLYTRSRLVFANAGHLERSNLHIAHEQRVRPRAQASLQQLTCLSPRHTRAAFASRGPPRTALCSQRRYPARSPCPRGQTIVANAAFTLRTKCPSTLLRHRLQSSFSRGR